MAIKGRYVAQIEVNFMHDEKDPNILPFEEIKKNLNEITPELQKLLENELCDENDCVTVTQMFADVWRAE
jgi:hypothetical protein